MKLNAKARLLATDESKPTLEGAIQPVLDVLSKVKGADPELTTWLNAMDKALVNAKGLPAVLKRAATLPKHSPVSTKDKTLARNIPDVLKALLKYVKECRVDLKAESEKASSKRVLSGIHLYGFSEIVNLMKLAAAIAQYDGSGKAKKALQNAVLLPGSLRQYIPEELKEFVVTKLGVNPDYLKD